MRRGPLWTVTAAAVAAVAGAVAGGGCNGGPASTKPADGDIGRRQDAALRDPMGYKQPVGRISDDGDITHLDGSGLKRDLNDVFNP